MKPIVFLSHSSRDARALQQLKAALVQKTGGSVDFFLSSDGQSIRFGRNWVHEIEQALGEAKLMFVFVSPASLNSQWIFFEAGFAYSKGVQVVPVAVTGIDMAKIPAPLSLLQGFNINSGASLNNLLSVINREFSYMHAETFTQQDYEEFFPPPRVVRRVLNDHWEWVDTIWIITEVEFEQARSNIEEVYRTHDIPYRVSPHDVISYGITYRSKIVDSRKRETEREVLAINIDPSDTATHYPLIKEIIHRTAGQDSSLALQYCFYPLVGCLPHGPRRTVKLRGSGIGFGSYSDLVYDGVSFYLDHKDIFSYAEDHLGIGSSKVLISVGIPASKLAEFNIRALVRILFQCGVLFLMTDG